MTVFATIFAKNYLAHARTLMASVARVHPEAGRVALLVDEPDGCFQPAAEGFEIVSSGNLPVPGRAHFFFKYTRLEASTALKPLFLKWLFAERGAGRIVYLDPDIELYAPLDPVFAALEQYSYVLTPHLLTPDAPGQSEILRCGAFNLGFLALRSGHSTRALLDWWAAKTLAEGFVDLRRGLFVDQRWMDLGFALFPEGGVLRDPGCNVAWWNLAERPLDVGHHGFRSAGQPLRFFHFSGYNPRRPNDISCYAPGRQVDQERAEGGLFGQHRRNLLENGYQTVSDWPYTYANFADGEPIIDFCRRVAGLDPRWNDIALPFSQTASQVYLDFWTSAHGPGGLSRLLWQIYLDRDDLQRTFPMASGRDARAFRDWFWVHGRREYGLPDRLARRAMVSAGGGTMSQMRVYPLPRLRYMLDVLAKRLKRNG